MPGIKKRAGKTTFTIYAAEARQFRGVIDILNFVELNHDKDDMLCGNAGVLASGLAAILDRLEKPKPKEESDATDGLPSEGATGSVSGPDAPGDAGRPASDGSEGTGDQLPGGRTGKRRSA